MILSRLSTFAFTLHVKGIPSADRDLRAHRRMADRAFADELRRAAGIFHINPDRSRRELVADAAARGCS